VRLPRIRKRRRATPKRGKQRRPPLRRRATGTRARPRRRTKARRSARRAR
jgi:hypothetical protein